MAERPDPVQAWLVDTNIISELMRDMPDARVLGWLDAQAQHRLFIAAVSIMELRFGMARLPDGRRKRALESAFEAVISEDFAGRVRDFDAAAADAAGRLQARNEAMGRTVAVNDTMIAGIALANRMGIVTRNTADFQSLDVPVLDPFDG